MNDRRRFLRALAVGAIAAGACPLRLPPALAGESAPERFVPLFDGKSLSGWVPVNVAPGTFTVRDGMIVSTGVPTGVMRTDRQYENFILELEWKHLRKGGNAGLFVHSEPISAPGVPFAKAIEVQIIDGDSPEGIWTGHGDIFSIHGAKMVPDRPHPRGWERCLPSERRARPAGEWNRYRVESRDGRVTLAVNGKEVSGGSLCSPRKGYICLEAEGSECWFRDIRILELPSTGAPPEETAGLDEGFRSLYTGMDLSGWEAAEAHRGHWTARDWILECDGAGPGELRSVPAWDDGEVIGDFRLGEGASAALAIIGAGEGAGAFEIPLESPSGGWRRVRLTLRGSHLRVAIDGKTVDEGERPGLPAGPRRLALRHRGRPVGFGGLYLRRG